MGFRAWPNSRLGWGARCAHAAAAGALALFPACGLKPGADNRRYPEHHKVLEVTAQDRSALLARARVWAQPDVPIEKADFRATMANLLLLPTGELPCRFIFGAARGTTPKFDCELPTGEIVRVKYGYSAELHAEAAATQLLSALGFGADRVSLVRVVRCFGCPYSPYYTLRVLDFFNARDAYRRRINYAEYGDFAWAAVERRMNVPSVISGEIRGWGWDELDKIDSARGGATPAEVDSFRLMALFLNHWDNKRENQRFVCLPSSPAKTACPQPFAMIQDTGASFGPYKLDLDGWRKTRIWSNDRTCEASMSSLPYGGSTFKPVRISEDGRRFFLNLIGSLTEKQLRALVETARFAEYAGGGNREERNAQWVAAFRDRVQQIAAHAPCP